MYVYKITAGVSQKRISGCAFPSCIIEFYIPRQAPIFPGRFSLPFPWNIIFAIYIVKHGYYCKFCSRNIFYSCTDVVGALHYCIYLVYFACELRPSGSPQPFVY